MKIGDFFSPNGYDVVATMQYENGDLLVLGNNSSHFLVAEKEYESMTDGEPQQVKLIGSFPYTDDWVTSLETALVFTTSTAIASMRRGYLQDVVEKAERKAGWDPNP